VRRFAYDRRRCERGKERTYGDGKVIEEYERKERTEFGDKIE